MSMPFYVAPEQVMKDRADYARKGIARGRSLVALELRRRHRSSCAENPSRTLHKISEIYDRIAFAGVGKYNEFDQLRIAGVRHADLKGYSYSREDVDARSLANAVRPDPRPDLHPRDEAVGGRDPRRRGRRDARPTTSCSTSSTTAPSSTSTTTPSSAATPRRSPSGVSQTWSGRPRRARRGRASRSARSPAPTARSAADDLEVAVLDRSNGRRAFRRLDDDEVAARPQLDAASIARRVAHRRRTSMTVARRRSTARSRCSPARRRHAATTRVERPRHRRERSSHCGGRPRRSDGGAAIDRGEGVDTAAITITASEYKFDGDRRRPPAASCRSPSTTTARNRTSSSRSSCRPGKTAADALPILEPKASPIPRALAEVFDGDPTSSFYGTPGLLPPGDTETTVADFAPGSYVLACFLPSPDGTPHSRWDARRRHRRRRRHALHPSQGTFEIADDASPRPTA